MVQAGLVLGPLAAGLAVAAGFANVKKILSTNTSGKGGAGASSGGSVPQAPSPSFNLVQGTGSNQIAETLQQQNKPIEAVVISGNITTAQSVDRNIVENAAL